MGHKFKIGDRVIIGDSCKYRAEAYALGLKEFMIHGRHTLHKSNPKAKVVHIYNQYYVVNYINELDKEMQLGFLEDNLELKKRSSVYQIY